MYSNTGPKVKDGGMIGENVRRDNNRQAYTVRAADSTGKDFTKADGSKRDPAHQYMNNDLKRGGSDEKTVDKHLHTVRLWNSPVSDEHRTDDEKNHEEKHYDAHGKETTEDKASSGFTTRNGRTYRYTNHHVIPKRFVDGSPADDRLFDSHHMEQKYGKRDGGMYSSKGKRHGGIIMTSPTESTSTHKRVHSEFTHPVAEQVENIVKTGRYESDHPDKQEAARGKEYKEATEAVPIKKISGLKKAKL
jgi:hypothetical protein